MARAIRAARFDNLWTAVELFNQLSDDELAHAQKACIHYDKPIRVSELKHAIINPKSEEIVPPAGKEILNPKSTLPSLEINFCNITCENPFFLAS